MFFARLFSLAALLLAAVQVLAAPVNLPLPIKRNLSVRDSSDVAARALSVQSILAGVRANIDGMKSELATMDKTKDNNQSIQRMTTDLKTTFDTMMSDLRALKKAKTSEINAKVSANGLFDLGSIPIVGNLTEIVKDIITLVGQIQDVIKSQSASDTINGIIDILSTILKAAPSVISLVLSIIGFF